MSYRSPRHKRTISHDLEHPAHPHRSAPMRFLNGFLLGVLFLPALGVAIGFRGALPIAATTLPAEWEARLADRAVTASLAREAEWLKNPHEMTDETLLAGLKLYRNGCAGCHGDRG